MNKNEKDLKEKLIKLEDKELSKIISQYKLDIKKEFKIAIHKRQVIISFYKDNESLHKKPLEEIKNDLIK